LHRRRREDSIAGILLQINYSAVAVFAAGFGLSKVEEGARRRKKIHRFILGALIAVVIFTLGRSTMPCQRNTMTLTASQQQKDAVSNRSLVSSPEPTKVTNVQDQSLQSQTPSSCTLPDPSLPSSPDPRTLTRPREIPAGACPTESSIYIRFTAVVAVVVVRPNRII
jgi:hypothetical protein